MSRAISEITEILSQSQAKINLLFYVIQVNNSKTNLKPSILTQSSTKIG